MADKKPHWTQTEAGKKRMSLIQRRAHARKRLANGGIESLKGRALAKAEVSELARYGAERRLADLEKEIVKLRIFLGRSS